MGIFTNKRLSFAYKVVYGAHYRVLSLIFVQRDFMSSKSLVAYPKNR